MKTIIAAAIRDHNGRVYSLPPPARHHNIIRHMVQEEGCEVPVTGDQGFMDSDLCFVDRTEGARIAIEAGQVARESNPHRLYSEDLW